MSPEVQTYGEEKVQPQGIPSARVSPDASTANFGGGQAAEAATQATLGAEDEVKNLALEAKSRADQVAHMVADNSAAEKQLDIQTNIQKMKGQDALQAQDYAEKEWGKFSQDLVGGAHNDAQKMAIMGSVNSRGMEIHRFTQTHMTAQMQEFAGSQAKAGVQNAVNLAVQSPYDSENIENQRKIADAHVIDQATRMGVYLGPDGKPTDTFKAMQAEQVGGLDKAVVQAMLDKDDPRGIQAAKDYLDTHKDGMNAQEMLASRKLLENSETKQLGLNYWDQVKGYRLSDGTPDTGKMEAQVMNDPDLPALRKSQIVSFIKGKSGEQRVQFNQQMMANDKSFQDQVSQARHGGTPYETALKLADQFSQGDHDRDVKTNYISSVYAPPTDSNSTAVENMKERILRGEATLAEIDAGARPGPDNVFNPRDQAMLHFEYFKANNEGHTPQMKYANMQVDDLASTYFFNASKRNLFKHAVDIRTQGLSPDEKVKTAHDMMKDDPNTGWHGWFQSPEWQTNAKTADATSMAWGQADQDIGHDQRIAIGQGVLSQGADAYKPSHIDEFANHFGGYQNLKKGTPVNNAIQSIMQAGQIVTPQGVKWVLSRSASGKLSK